MMTLITVCRLFSRGYRQIKSDSIRPKLPSTAAATQTAESFLKNLLMRLGASVGVLSVAVVFIDIIGHPAVVVGSSMEPTLHGKDKKWWNRDIIWLSRINLHTPQRGEVFAFIPPNNPEKRHIKRVVALDGDLIRPQNGPSYLEVPTGCCWMESDNPKNFSDSRSHGPVCIGLLTGRATHIIWPPRRWRSIKNEVFEHSTVPISRRFSLFGFPFSW